MNNAGSKNESKSEAKNGSKNGAHSTHSAHSGHSVEKQGQAEAGATKVVETEGTKVVSSTVAAGEMSDDAFKTKVLTKQQKWGSKKPRLKYQEQVPLLLDLYDGHPTQLGTDPSSDEIRQRLAALVQQEVTEKAAQKVLAEASSVRFANESAIWTAMMQIYKRAKGSDNAEIRAAVKPFAEYMKNGPRAPKPAGDPAAK